MNKKIVIEKEMKDYSEEIQKLLRDIKKEVEEGISDGIVYKLSSKQGSDSDILYFL